MKRILIALALVSTALVSCSEKFFEQYPSNSITEGNFYQTQDDFNQGVYSCYAKLKTAMSFHLTELAYRTDECILESMAVSTQDRYDLDHFAVNASNGIISDIWNAWYNGIYRCNDVLDHMPGKDFEKLPEYKAEVLFMRAWWYFNLYRCFGGVPLATKVETPGDSKLIARCTDEQMYELLVSDLTYAINNLPEKRGAEKARVTKIAAQALLGKVYLTFKKYYEAENVLKDAMDGAAAGGYGLETTTAKAFDVNNKMGKEILFALYYNKTNDNGHGYWYSSNTAVEADRRNPTPEFLSIFNKDDNRYALIQTYTNRASGVYAMAKWDDKYDATYTTQVGNDFPHLRYADVVLMRAEALAQQEKVADALPFMNQIRQRAGIADFTNTDKAAFIAELGNERGREFALEGQRWFDLVRLDLAADYFKINRTHYLLPIPNDQIEIVNNTDILWQNPGY